MSVEQPASGVPESPPLSSGERAEPAAAPFYDLVVLGDGPAATAAARWAAGRGVRVAWVQQQRAEASREICYATLAATARRLYDLDRSAAAEADGESAWEASGEGAWDEELGAAALKEASLDRGELLRSGCCAVEVAAAAEERWCGGGVARYGGRAELAGARRLQVGGERLEFGRLVLAPQSVAEPAEVPGSEEVEAGQPESLAARRIPRQLVIVGGGAWSCRWAQLFARFGVEVHLCSPSAGLLPEIDAEAAAVIAAQLQAERVRLYLGCDRLQLSRMGTRRAAVLTRDGRKEMLLADEVVIEPRRRWRLEGWRLGMGEVAANEAGIVIDPWLRTTNPRVFVAGEACFGGRRSAAFATATARIAVDNALAALPWRLGSRRFRPETVPHLVDLDPQVVQWGPAEAPSGRLWRWLRWSPDEPRGELFGGGGRGLLKVAVERETGRIAAVTAVARSAAEWVAPLLVLAAQGWPLEGLESLEPLESPRLAALRGLAEAAAHER